MNINFTLNGRAVQLDLDPERSAADVLREDLRLTGTKIGCDTQDCGVCSILLDDRLAKACSLKATHLDGRQVTTIEGLGGPNDQLTDLQAAFLDHGAIQCGFCIPAMVLAGEALLRRNPAPTRDDIRKGLANVLCRCTGYQQIVDAIAETARSRQAAQQMVESAR